MRTKKRHLNTCLDKFLGGRQEISKRRKLFAHLNFEQSSIGFQSKKCAISFKTTSNIEIYWQSKHRRNHKHRNSKHQSTCFISEKSNQQFPVGNKRIAENSLLCICVTASCLQLDFVIQNPLFEDVYELNRPIRYDIFLVSASFVEFQQLPTTTAFQLKSNPRGCISTRLFISGSWVQATRGSPIYVGLLISLRGRMGVFDFRDFNGIKLGLCCLLVYY